MAAPVQAELDYAVFREHVAEWIEDNKDGVGGPVDAADLTYEQFSRNRAFLRALGAQGWYAPAWPAEFGGGGLDLQAGEIVREEMNRRIPHLENVHPPGDIGQGVASSLWLLGSAEQKQRFLPPVLSGDMVSWELYTEPEAGSDLPSLRTQAVRDGDSYVISGTKVFVGGHFECDQMYVLAVTDPAGKRQQNLSVFLVPADSSGITVTDLNMIAGSVKRSINLDRVRVAADRLIGSEGDGWTSFNSMFAGQAFGHVGIGSMPDRDEYVLRQFFDYCRTAIRGERTIASHPNARSALTRLWMKAEADRLLRARNARMVERGEQFSYQSAQASLNRKLLDVEVSGFIHRILGPLATVSDPRWAPAGGEFEYFQRYATLQTHPGGTCEVQRIRFFRGMQFACPDLCGERSSNGSR
jgi:alkylation response protein AidB-like acyl-CoA dehydrogenase